MSSASVFACRLQAEVVWLAAEAERAATMSPGGTPARGADSAGRVDLTARHQAPAALGADVGENCFTHANERVDVEAADRADADMDMDRDRDGEGEGEGMMYDASAPPLYTAREGARAAGAVRCCVGAAPREREAAQAGPVSGGRIQRGGAAAGGSGEAGRRVSYTPACTAHASHARVFLDLYAVLDYDTRRVKIDRTIHA